MSGSDLIDPSLNRSRPRALIRLSSEIGDPERKLALGRKIAGIAD
jgi:hypothetical protein